jgi:hypothetical protein
MEAREHPSQIANNANNKLNMATTVALVGCETNQRLISGGLEKGHLVDHGNNNDHL